MSVPNSREVQEFEFKLLTRLRVFPDSRKLQFDGNLNLVAAASRYGLIFVGTPTGFNVINVADIVELQASVKKKPSEFCDYSTRRINLGTQPSHLDVSCDCQLLAVSIIRNGRPQIMVYSVASFTSQEVAVVKEVRCESRVTCMSWNPAIPSMLAVCLANGVAAVYEFSNVSVNINTATDVNAMCLCWSPKGKQVVIGSSKGTLSQHLPDLKLYKTFPQPSYCSNPMCVISVQWVSVFQFLAVYKDTVNTNERPGVVIVNAPKTGPVTYLNYDDICYSSGTLRDPQFYVIHQQTWNVIMVASGNSMEVGVLGLENDSWVQWIQEDAARADLPLSSNKQETYVVGMAFDTSAQYNLPYGENQNLPPMPLLILLSHEGLLCFFFAVNILPSSAVICSPPELLSDMSGVHLFTLYLEPEVVEDVQCSDTGPAFPDTVIKPVITSQPPSWLNSSVPSQSVQTNKQKLWSNMPSSGILSWTSPEITPLSQPQQSQIHAVFQKPENENSSATHVSPATMWATTSAFTQQSFVPQQPVTSAEGQVHVTMGSVGGTKESPGVLSPQVTVAIKPQQLPKPLTNRPEITPKISEIFRQEVTEEIEETSKFSDGVIEATLMDTINQFNSDMAELAESVRNMNCHIGTPEEKVEFQQRLDNMEEFLNELSETTAAQKSEIKSLKSSLFDLFAWIEDARSRMQQLSEQRYTVSTELDPVSARKMSNIEHLLYYTNSQISQINAMLDDRWEQAQDTQSKKKSSVLKTPRMESVFQVLSLQNKIISKYSLMLDDIEKRINDCRNNSRLPLISKLSLESYEYTEDNEFSKLAESVLGIKLAKARIPQIKAKSDQNSLKERLKSEQRKKIVRCQKLQEFLSNNPVLKIETPKSFLAVNMNNQKKTSLSGLSLPVTGVKLGGISSGQPVITKDVNTLNDSKSAFDNQKALDINKTSQSSFKNVFDVTQSSKNISGTVVKTNIVKTHQDISQFGGTAQDSSGVTFIEGKVVSKIPDSGFQRIVTNAENNELMKPAVLVQNSPLGSLSNIVASIPDTQKSVLNGKASFVNDSKSDILSDTPKLKDSLSGVIPPKSTFGKELDQTKSDLISLTGSSKISFGSGDDKKIGDSSAKLFFGVNNTSQDFFKNTASSPEISKNIFGSSASPFKSVFAGSPVTSEIPGLAVSKTSTDIKSPKSVFGGTLGTNNIFTFSDLKQAESTEPVSTDGNVGVTKNIFSTKTTSDIPKTILSQPTTVSSESIKINSTIENKTSKNIFGMTGSAVKNILPTTAENNKGPPDHSSVKPSAGNEVVSVKSHFASKPAVEPPKLIFGSSTTGNSALANTENSGSNKITFSGDSGFPKPLPATTSISSQGNLVSPPNTTAGNTETSNKYVSSVTLPLSSSSISETENIEQKNVSKNKTENIERKEEKQNTASQDTSLPLLDNLSLEQTASPSTATFCAEPASDPENENKTDLEKQNISPVKSTSGSVPITTSSFSSFLNVQNTSLSSPSVEALSSPVSNIETKTVSGTGDTSGKPVSSTMPEKSSTVQAASTFNFTLPTTTEAVTQPTFTFSLPTTSSEKAVSSSFRFTQPDTTVDSTTVASSSTFSFGQLASTVTTTTADDKNTKISLSFGNPQTTVSTSSPMFSGFTTPQTVTSNLFGQPVSTTSTTSTAPETCFSFTIPTTTTSQNSFFGSKSNVFGTPTTTTVSSIFGQPIGSPASTANSPFGQTTSVFGQATSPASPFGTSSAFNTKPTFGQSGGSLFGQTSSGGFNTSGASIFGGNSMFGATGNNSGNLFQSSGTSSIFGGGSTSPGGSFSSGGQTISQAGFGSPNAFQNKPAGTFGGAPTFGSTPSFGGAPTFGGSPTFGSPNKVFGSTVPNTGFGTTQQSATFENLASQNTMTFGNLAQASSGSAFGGSVFGGGDTQHPQSSAFSGGSTSFGGSSFSSWR